MMMKLAAILIAAGAASGAPTSTRERPQVTIQNGTVVGTHSIQFNQDIFLGIPFAQPPIGDLRFMAPQSLNSSFGTLDASSYGPACYWTGGPDMHEHDGLESSEDCLTINVVRPTSATAKGKLPVFVWLYGGAFQHGAASRDLYNLSYPVHQSMLGHTPVIGVSLNYRTNGFGFLSDGKHSTLNNGLRDQRLALQWVQENIEQFGGDPSKVTVWGGSAGAQSVTHQMTAFGGRDDGLFKQVILESGYPTTMPPLGMHTARIIYQDAVNSFGCTNATDPFKCLQQVPAEKMKEVFSAKLPALIYSPVVDGDFMPDHPEYLFGNGSVVAVDAIAGVTRDEGTFPIMSLGLEVDTDEQLLERLSFRYPPMNLTVGRELIALYPDDVGAPYGSKLYNTEFGKQWKRGNAIAGDVVMHAPHRQFTKDMLAHNKTVYSYVWGEPNVGPPPQLVATHMTDVVYAFANPTNLTQSQGAYIGYDASGRKQKLSQLTSRMFMSFIATGDPNYATVGFTHQAWPVYDGSERLYFFSANGTSIIEDNYRQEEIDYINSHVAEFRTGP